ncbi:cysteine hydrolase family protein [Ectobacillus sp. sgz5001026]|uniref:cysteine hydrolase family protein n=1 Tax=Ectobacillus sp. sgz5001026 TaxID=3242473 RepID=UPI0036D2A717
MRNTALFVMDVQPPYLNAVTPIEYTDMPAMLRTINEAIDKANHHNIVVVYVVTQNSGGDWWKKWRYYMDATEGRIMLDPRLKIINDMVFTKRRSSAFSNDRLAVFIRECKIHHIIVVGLLAETTISSTALQAKKKGFHVTIVEDAIAGTDADKKQSVCTYLAGEGIIVRKLCHVFSMESSLSYEKNDTTLNKLKKYD